MDFLNKQKEIKEYIESNLPEVLEEAELDNFDAYIEDYFDLDEYQQEKQLFYRFGTYSFDDLSNESEAETMTFSIILCFQDNTRKVSKENMMKYAGAFYEMFNRSGRNFGGVADIGKITDLTFYNAAEANQDVKVAEISITLITEI